MPILSNILALPLVTVSFVTGTNEDWLDAIVYFVADAEGNQSDQQLDIRGISFEMEIRRAAPDHEVILHATTEDGTIAFGFPPDVGYLLINVSHESMATREPGQYVGDIVARDAGFVRRVIEFDIDILEGITR